MYTNSLFILNITLVIQCYSQADVREDEEQTTKFQEIIDLLVAAGYFRARIKGLSNFDKVRELFSIFILLSLYVIKKIICLIRLLAV